MKRCFQMAPSRENIIEICTILAEQEKLQATIVQSSKGALVAGLGALFGGLLAGPLGLAVGGTVGSLAGAYSTRNSFKSVVSVINEMDHTSKQKLADSVQRCINNIRAEDFQTLLMIVLTNGVTKELILKEIGSFLMREMQMSIK